MVHTTTRLEHSTEQGDLSDFEEFAHGRITYGTLVKVDSWINDVD